MRERGPRSASALVALASALVLLFGVFLALGTWQVERRAWKLDLIARVEQRVRAPATPAPGENQWATVNSRDDEYRHIEASGTFLHDRQTLVQASTDLGSGFWVMTPLRQADGSLLLVNRGFVADRRRAELASQGPSGAVTVRGLLRTSQPGGGFLRHNDPAAGRWYSRDVEAIAAAEGLQRVAPYFLDADAQGAGRSGKGNVPGTDDVDGTAPVGGLTVVAFHNNHLVYAITWYALALMVCVAGWLVAREEARVRRRSAAHDGAFANEGTRRVEHD
ncbi:MAG: SURF1 family protein [Gammaproteobacteria bacterium]|nr:SURF1 family protein [Gammaproteobacteria bacterium]MBU1441294.1 SURF1 family protein [Gammaproteobacteria bacterium]MBU2286173.1 SURF1 family protein [Gammaproteobacteria bacterium]